MIEARKDEETPEEEEYLAGGDDDFDSADDEGESLSLSERRARRRAKKTSSTEDDDADGAALSVGGVTAPKAISTRKQRDALRDRERGTQTRAETLPIIGGLARYLRGVWAEIRKVTWPTREEARQLTVIVIAVTIVFAIGLGAIDFFYGLLFQLSVDNVLGFLLAATVFLSIAGGLSWYFIFREPKQSVDAIEPFFRKRGS